MAPHWGTPSRIGERMAELGPRLDDDVFTSNQWHDNFDPELKVLEQYPLALAEFAPTVPIEQLLGEFQAGRASQDNGAAFPFLPAAIAADGSNAAQQGNVTSPGFFYPEVALDSQQLRLGHVAPVDPTQVPLPISADDDNYDNLLDYFDTFPGVNDNGDVLDVNELDFDQVLGNAPLLFAEGQLAAVRTPHEDPAAAAYTADADVSSMGYAAGGSGHALLPAATLTGVDGNLLALHARLLAGDDDDPDDDERAPKRPKQQRPKQQCPPALASQARSKAQAAAPKAAARSRQAAPQQAARAQGKPGPGRKPHSSSRQAAPAEHAAPSEAVAPTAAASEAAAAAVVASSNRNKRGHSVRDAPLPAAPTRAANGEGARLLLLQQQQQTVLQHRSVLLEQRKQSAARAMLQQQQQVRRMAAASQQQATHSLVAPPALGMQPPPCCDHDHHNHHNLHEQQHQHQQQHHHHHHHHHHLHEQQQQQHHHHHHHQRKLRNQKIRRIFEQYKRHPLRACKGTHWNIPLCGDHACQRPECLVCSPIQYFPCMDPSCSDAYCHARSRYWANFWRVWGCFTHEQHGQWKLTEQRLAHQQVMAEQQVLAGQQTEVTAAAATAASRQ